MNLIEVVIKIRVVVLVTIITNNSNDDNTNQSTINK